MGRMSVNIANMATGLSDKVWEQTQIKTFTKWVNLYLGKRDRAIENIATDFADGINLIVLLEVVSDTKLGKYNKKPSGKFHELANLSVAHTFIKNFYKEVNIKVVPSPEQINDHDLRAILGLIWVLILRFSIADIDEGGMAAKEGLLLWCKRNTIGYEGVDPPGIDNFHTSWKNGLGFAALIHKHRPELLDYDSLDKSDPKAVMAHAFQVAEEKLGIPPLLDPEDIADVPKPDEKSLMTYVAEYWKVFSADTTIFLATKRLNRAINRRITNMALRDEYLNLAGNLLERINKEHAVLEAKTFGDNFDVLRDTYFDFGEYKMSTKPQLISLKIQVESSISSLQQKLQSEQFPAYSPPEGLTQDDINTKWQAMVDLEEPYEQALTGALTELFRKTFLHFDADESGNLTQTELQACFSALSLELGASESEKLFGTQSTIAFEPFFQCMMSKLIDSSDEQQIQEACKIVSKDKVYVCAEDLGSHLGKREMQWVLSSGANYEGDEAGGEDGVIDVDGMIKKLFSPL